jgi:HAD superfamily hydrolase (TIGR01509 family)
MIESPWSNLPTHIIFDLSEVIISGLKGSERQIGHELSLDEKLVAEVLVGEGFDALLHGRISEEEYLNALISRNGWEISPSRLMEIIRRNFHEAVPGMSDVLKKLSERFSLVLLSDHAREWILYIEAHYGFFNLFREKFYSFELNSTKIQPSTFLTVIEKLKVKSEECLFIDDNERNVVVAKSLGMRAIRFTGVDRLLLELRNHGITIECSGSPETGDR